MTKYKVKCYNGGPLFGLQIPFVDLNRADVEVEADNESEAISKARSKVYRDYYEVIGVV